MTDEEQDIGLLLPFYANGTLGEEESERVRLALARSAELREELDEIMAVQGMVSSGGAEWEAQRVPADEARLGNLLARIEAEEQAEAAAQQQAAPAAQPAPRPTPRPVRVQEPKRPGFFASLFQPAWKPAFAAMALVAMAQGAMLFNQAGTAPAPAGDSGYQTASGQQDGPTVSGFALLIRFREDAAWADIMALLDQEGLAIVDGPVGGMVQVAPEGELSDGAQQELVATLSANPIVRSVRPVR